MDDTDNINRAYTGIMEILNEHKVKVKEIINVATITDSLTEYEATDASYFDRKIRLDELDEEKKEFLKLSAPVHDIENLYQQEIYDSLIYRYKDMFTKFKPNEYAKRLL